MDLKNVEKTIDQADSFLTKLKNLLKKHWGILLILLVGYFFYWAFTTDFPEDELIDPIEEVAPPHEHNRVMEVDVDYYITKETYIIDNEGYRMGDTIYIDYYSDGYIDKYYTDGETFYE